MVIFLVIARSGGLLFFLNMKEPPKRKNDTHEDVSVALVLKKAEKL